MMKKRLQRIKDNLSNYHLYNIIGRGAFGEVRLASNIYTNQIVAIKRVEKKYVIEKKQIYNIYLQRDLMTNNNCQFIVQIKSAFQDQNYLYFAMQYIQGGDLLHLLIERDIFTEEETKFYVAEMVLAVQQIHRMNYIHRDIKPDNILIQKNGHIKVSDFGLSKYLECENRQVVEGKRKRFSKMEKLKKLDQIKNRQVSIRLVQKSFSKVGTPDYISPEVLIEKTYNHSVDLWGIGVIMFECLFGYPPFTDESSKQVCHKVANWIDYLQFPNDIEISTSAKMLILGLVNDSEHRLTIEEIKSHPFFEGLDWQNILQMKPPFIPQCRDEIDTNNFDLFQVVAPWDDKEKFAISKFNQKSKIESFSEPHSKNDQILSTQLEPLNRATIGPKFKFAGFDYRKLNEDPLELAFSDLQRKSCSHKSLKKISSKNVVNSGKHLKTEQHYSGKKKLMKPKKSEGKKSQLLYNSTTNNTSTSFNLSRAPTSKQFLLRTLSRQEAIEKQNQNHEKLYMQSHRNERQSSSRLKKKLVKNKILKKKQIQGIQIQKNKLKKVISMQSEIKNI